MAPPSVFSTTLSVRRGLLVTTLVVITTYAFLVEHASAFQQHQPMPTPLLQHSRRDGMRSVQATAPSTASSSPLFVSQKSRNLPISNGSFRMQKNLIATTRLLSATLEEKEPDGGIWWYYWYLMESRLFKMMLMPWKIFILKPFRILMEKMIARLAYDDTEDVDTLEADMETSPTTPLATSTTAVVSRPTGHATITKTSAMTSPSGNRWAIAADNVDLSGDWELIVTEDFRQYYDKYLAQLAQPKLVRSVAVGIVAQTTERLEQSDQGRNLLVSGKNIRGTWTRTLVSSGTDVDNDSFEPFMAPMLSADSEKVHAESWWEDDGSVHVSWMRGVTKYGGGSFESRRYLEGDNSVYVCDSAFHPNDTKKDPIKITWKFRRQNAE